MTSTDFIFGCLFLLGIWFGVVSIKSLLTHSECFVRLTSMVNTFTPIVVMLVLLVYLFETDLLLLAILNRLFDDVFYVFYIFLDLQLLVIDDTNMNCPYFVLTLTLHILVNNVF